MAETAAVDVAGNLARVRERIGQAAARAGRDPQEVLLVGISKTVEPARMRQAVAAGLTDLGENYVQEAQEKFHVIGPGPRWHLVGHLQRNKVKAALQIFDLVQTVDSERLGREISRVAEARGRPASMLMQVNTSGEESKYGVPPPQAEALARALAELPGVRLEGLMTIGRWEPDPEAARAEFRLLAGLFSQLRSDGRGREMRYLSMGMSHDFEVAIEEGSTLVRVGTAIFGPRPARSGVADG